MITSGNSRRTLVVAGTLGLIALGMGSAPVAAGADPHSAIAVSRPHGDSPPPTYRPGPKGSAEQPPKSEDDTPTRYYSNCTQVINDGKWPLYAGQPGYSRLLDPDGDGIACD
ncbi:excalibur calcium-binding domain-containing protein [Nocardia sp. NPDC005366]|uniref:excalibur calcium-binding domain-containing protein n=1 Tax=Nocardia sp. NPDC005366 TaxID=3156878 RepID=UPI0033AFC02D